MDTTQLPAQKLFFEQRQAFFGGALGDILRAIRGQAYVGSFALSMCAIAALAEIEWCTRNQQEIADDGYFSKSHQQLASGGKRDAVLFKGWIQDWIVKPGLNSKIDPAKVYAIRNALVHSYGAVDGLKAAGAQAYLLRKCKPNLHCTTQPMPLEKVAAERYVLNLENLVSEIMIAADAFFHAMRAIWELQMSDGLTRRLRGMVTSGVVDSTGILSSRRIDNVGLGEFDNRLIETPLQLGSVDVEKIIHDIYVAGDKCTCQMT